MNLWKLSKHLSKVILKQDPDLTLDGLDTYVTPMPNRINIKIVLDEIAKQQTDAIVNSICGNVGLSSGALSNSIMQSMDAASKQAVQDEAKQKAPNGLQAGEVITTSAGNLASKSIFHIYLPIWTDDNAATQYLQIALDNILTQAHQAGLKSLAMPAVGTGISNWPPELVAKTIFDAVIKCSQNNSSTSLASVNLVIHPKDKDNLLAFIYYLMTLLSEQRAKTPLLNLQGIVNVLLPGNWMEMKAEERLISVELSPSNMEYVSVRTAFNQTAKGYTILKIERIQNAGIYKRYAIHKIDMQLAFPNTCVKRMLWHGTSSETVHNINCNGFNRSYNGQHGVVYGKGVYFAQNASYSVLYAKADASGLRHMYYTSVLTGDYAEGKSDMIEAPVKDPSYPNIRYDSTVDKKDNPTIFVVYADSQAYPKYLITFK